MYFGDLERSPPPSLGTDPEESVSDFRVSIIDGVRTCLEFNLAGRMALNRPNSEPGVVDLHTAVPGSTLLSALAVPERLGTTTIDGPGGPTSPELLLSNPTTGLSWRDLRTCRCTIKITTRMMTEAIVREMIKGSDALLLVPPDPLPLGVGGSVEAAAGRSWLRDDMTIWRNV